MTDQELLSEVQRVVIEPVNGGQLWPSGLWTRSEVLGYLNQRQHRFLKETAIVTATGYVTYNGTTTTGTLPADWIATLRVAYRVDSTRVLLPLEPTSVQEADWGRPLHRQAAAGTPLVWADAEGEPPLLTLMPLPAAGRAEIVYVGAADPCTGNGTILNVPDMLTPYLRYGVLADMWGKQGRGADPQRAAYCEQRYQEGIDLARELLYRP